MNNKGNYIKRDGFKRYLTDEMTNAERNEFEKKLQKNQFEEEALEGLEAFTSLNFQDDLNILRNKIENKKQKNRLPFFAAAATILLLITAGIIWINIDRRKPIPVISENSIKKAEKAETKKILDKSTNETKTKQTEHKNEQLEQKHFTEPEKNTRTPKTNKTTKQKTPTAKKLKDEKKHIEKLEETEAEEEVVYNIIAHDEAEAEIKINEPIMITKKSFTTPSVTQAVKGKVISSDDKTPIAGVTIVEKGTQNSTISNIDGIFKLNMQNDTNTVVANFIGMEQKKMQLAPDSDNTIALSPENDMELNEVTVVAYGTEKKKSTTESTRQISDKKNETARAKPACGYKQYNNYLRDNAILHENINKNKVTVKLKLVIDSNGHITSISNTNHAREELFTRAKKIIKNGPAWQPKITQTGKKEDTVNLKITFRKQKK